MLNKYVVSYLINKKTGLIIRDKLKSYFNKYNIQLQFGTVNDSEFNNKKVKHLLDINNIIHIRGKPYNPHSQGEFEPVHRTIKNGIICKYIKIKINLIYVVH